MGGHPEKVLQHAAGYTQAPQSEDTWLFGWTLHSQSVGGAARFFRIAGCNTAGSDSGLFAGGCLGFWRKP